MWKMSRRRSVQAVTGERNVKKEHRGEKMSVPPVPLSRRSVELHLEQTKSDQYDSVAGGWIDSIPSSPYAKFPPLKLVTSQVAPRHDSPIELSRRSTSPAKTLPVRTRKSSISSTSTLFERSSSIPITIIVTTPEDEVFPDSANSTSDGPSIRRGDSTMSLPPLNSQIVPDRTRLMPPIDPQLDMRRLKKAREFEEIRMFLIGFLNTKGTKLPGNLRTRIMSIYGITDGNLDPKVVEKFGTSDGADLDESLVLNLGLQGGTPSNRDHMKILDLAFQSVLPSAAPMAAQDLMALRRKSMMAPVRGSSKGPSRPASLYSVDERSSVSQNMSLSVNSKSKQLMDDIIKKRASAQNASASQENLTNGSFSKTPGRPQSLFGRRKSVSMSTVKKAESLYTPEPKSTPSLSSQHGSTSSLSSRRPQSLYGHRANTMPTINSARSIPKAPLPAFNNHTSKSRQPNDDLRPVISITPYRPGISSRLTSSPVTAYHPEPVTRPRQHLLSSTSPITDPTITSITAAATRLPPTLRPAQPNIFKQEKPLVSPVVVVTRTVEVSPSTLDASSTLKSSPVKSLRPVLDKAPCVQPEVEKAQSPPVVKQVAPVLPVEESKQVIQSAASSLTSTQEAPVALSSKRPSPIIPEPIKICLPLEDEPIIHCPTPISPAHRLTHKGLTRSEISEIEKPFYTRRRRSSSASRPPSPIFSSPEASESSSNGYESDSSGVVFPVHPGFAPLGKENCRASMRVEELRHRKEEATRIEARKSLVPSKVGTKSKKEKRSSFFGSLKKSLFGRS